LGSLDLGLATGAGVMADPGSHTAAALAFASCAFFACSSARRYFSA
jgi:hypothetical protein